MLRPEHLPELARRGIAVVPTLVIGDAVLATVAAMGAGPDAVAELRAVLDGLPHVVRQAAELGVTVLAGTDAGMVPHGRIADEVRLLLTGGLEPEIALGAASWTAREWLGLPGVEEGAPADAVVYPDDPRGDPQVLLHPRHVLLDGRSVEPGTAVSRL